MAIFFNCRKNRLLPDLSPKSLEVTSLAKDHACLRHSCLLWQALKFPLNNCRRRCSRHFICFFISGTTDIFSQCVQNYRSSFFESNICQPWNLKMYSSTENWHIFRAFSPVFLIYLQIFVTDIIRVLLKWAVSIGQSCRCE